MLKAKKIKNKMSWLLAWSFLCVGITCLFVGRAYVLNLEEERELLRGRFFLLAELIRDENVDPLAHKLADVVQAEFPNSNISLKWNYRTIDAAGMFTVEMMVVPKAIAEIKPVEWTK